MATFDAYGQFRLDFVDFYSVLQNVTLEEQGSNWTWDEVTYRDYVRLVDEITGL